jgi:hypothetical protein
MLVGTPRPVILSVFQALGPALWIRKTRFESWRGQLTVLALGRTPLWPRDNPGRMMGSSG